MPKKPVACNFFERKNIMFDLSSLFEDQTVSCELASHCQNRVEFCHLEYLGIS